MADRGHDREMIRNIGEPSRRPGTPNAPGSPTDAGKTSGGGSLGHDQPPRDQSRIRNEGSTGRAGGGDRETPDPLPELEP